MVEETLIFCDKLSMMTTMVMIVPMINNNPGGDEMAEEQEVLRRKMPSLEQFAKIDAKNRTMTPFGTYERFAFDKRRIKQAIDGKDIDNLRKFSQYFYHASGEYRRLVEYFSKILTYEFLVVPMGEPKAISSPKATKALEKILDYTSKAHIEETCREIAFTVVKDGAYFGYERVLDDIIVLQQLPTEYCRSNFKINGNFSVEFDFSFFDQYRGEEELKTAFLSMPDEFKKMHKRYLADKQLNRWQLLDPNFARAHFLSDPTPLLSATFIDLLEYEDYKGYNREKVEQENEEIVVQEVPVDEDGELTMELDEIITLHQNATAMLNGSRRRVLTTPAKISALQFRSNRATEQDEVEKAARNIYGSAGTPMVLFSSGSSGSSMALEKSIESDESFMYPLLDQFKLWYEMKFKLVAGKNKNFHFNMLFLKLSVFNRSKRISEYAAGAASGLPTKLMWAAAMGLEQKEMVSLLAYENEILKLNETMIPVSNTHTQPSPGSGDEGGRPRKEGPLSEEGDATRDQGKDESRTKPENQGEVAETNGTEQ